MKTGLISLVLLAGASLAAGPDVLVVSEAAKSDPTARCPAPDQPVYYVLASLREHALGEPLAGERRVSPAAIEQEVVAMLAPEGYTKSAVGGPMPSLALFVVWGSASLVVDEIDEGLSAAARGRALALGADDLSKAIATRTYVRNRDEIAWLVGAVPRNEPGSLQGASELNADATETRLYLGIIALDAAALARKEKKLIWQIRTSVAARRAVLAESLHAMMTSAGPYVGRDLMNPVRVTDADRRKAEVHVGAPRVVDETTAVPTPPPVPKGK